VFSELPHVAYNPVKRKEIKITIVDLTYDFIGRITQQKFKYEINSRNYTRKKERQETGEISTKTVFFMSRSPKPGREGDPFTKRFSSNCFVCCAGEVFDLYDVSITHQK